MANQNEIREALQVKSTIDAKAEVRDRIQFLKDYCKTAHAKGFVLGISGGQDSSLAGRLAQLAVEELRQEGYDATFYAVRLPYGVQHDEDDAQLALQFIKPDHSLVFNIKPSVDAVAVQYSDSIDTKGMSDFNKGNVKARMRMIAQYAIGGENNCLVIGTDHAAEAITGFYTKFGDGGADLLPLSGLSKRQGRQLLIELGAEERIYLKTPTADLLDNKPQQADETELGITYDDIDDFLEGKEVSADVKEKLEKRYTITQHKRELPATKYDKWWK